MPVTLSVAQHEAKKWSKRRIDSEGNLLKGSCDKAHGLSKGIIQSSFRGDALRGNHISPSKNGLVYTAYEAYSQHHHLTLRPEDVWFAILSQLGFHINAHAEELRHLFVSHEGRKELEIIEMGTIHSVDFGDLAVRMTGLIQKNVLDPDLRAWVMPSFSTTTDIDRVVASVLLMGAVQKYFSYLMSLRCGIPSVTLLGEREDWVEILARIPKLERLGKEPTHFAELLKPVLRRIVDSFDHPESEATKDFWNKIAHRTGGSGPQYLSGWITAFCFWDEEGKCLYASGPIPPVSSNAFAFEEQHAGCQLDQVLYHRINTNDVPPGYASVPVTVDDNGVEYQTEMLAGSVGIQATNSGNALRDNEGRDIAGSRAGLHLDSIQPTSGWWMYIVEGPKERCEADPDVNHSREESRPWRTGVKDRVRKMLPAA